MTSFIGTSIDLGVFLLVTYIIDKVMSKITKMSVNYKRNFIVSCLIYLVIQSFKILF